MKKKEKWKSEQVSEEIETISEKEIKATDIVGRRFEELDSEEMKDYQGSGEGDVFPEDIFTITTLLSKKDYKC